MAKINIADMGLQRLTTHGRIEFVIDLKKTDEEVFSGFSTHHRRKVKKAKKHTMDLYEASSMDALREFRKLQVMSRDRRLEKGEDIGILDDAYYEILGQNYFANRLGRVFIMRSEGRPLSAAFVSIFGQKALYMYGGSSDEGFKKDAPVLLFQHIFRRCRELGCVEFNLGGVPAESVNKGAPSFGLYRFKSGFGGHQVACTNGYNHRLISAENCLFQISNLLNKQRKRIWMKES
jgi:lipid II:glycine glycyltransferase (peptidoglycan interpeptide bridge formation enzyme)